MEFINFLNDKIGQENYILTLTSDHGVAPFPELAINNGSQAKRISYNKFELDIDSIDLLVQKELNLNKSCILASSGYRGVEPNFKILNSYDIDTLELINTIQYHLKKLNYVKETISFMDINNLKCNKIFIEKTRNSYNPNHGYFIKIIGEKNHLIDYRHHGTTHGSPLFYDTHVPLIFLGSNILSSQINDAASTVDITPTLLDYIGIQAMQIFDGNKLNLILK
jgi:arylsulfatase A-like enzyme